MLNADDVAAFADPPRGFKAKREGIPHGKLEMVSYESKSVGSTRKMNVYTPPGYSAEDKKVPSSIPLCMASAETRRSGCLSPPP